MVVSLNVSANNQKLNELDFHKYDNQIYITPVQNQDIVDINHNDREQKKGKKLGIGIAVTSLLTAGGVFVLTKGLPPNATKMLRKYINKLEEKINLRNIRGQGSAITSLYLKVLNGLNKFMNRATSINNFTSLKDILFSKFTDKSKFTNKICTSITSFFEKLAKKTVNNKYTGLDKKFTNLFSKFSKLQPQYELNKKVSINGVEKTVQEWLETVNNLQNNISSQYTKGFGLDCRLKRYNAMKAANLNLDKRVWETAFNGMGLRQSLNQNWTNLRSSQVHKSFIAEDLLAKDKANLNKEVSQIRNLITYDIDDKYKISKGILDDIFKFISPKDLETNKVIKSLRGKISAYRRLNGANEQQLRTKLNQEIQEELQKLKQNFTQNNEVNYDTKVVESVFSYISNIEKTLTSANDKGALQEILTIYKTILPKKDYVKIKKEVYSTIKELDKSIDMENNKFFDKLRDLKLGSAPTDVLTLLGSIGGVGLGLANADNAEERKSALLKYGIPVVGGIATTLILTVRMTAGFKSLALGFISSILLGKLGVGVDNHVKQLKQTATETLLAENVVNTGNKENTKNNTVINNL